MSTIPKKFDPELRVKAVRLVMVHRAECPNLTAASTGRRTTSWVRDAPAPGLIVAVLAPGL